MSVAIVTGAGGDIGKAIVAALRASTVTVIAADINDDAAQATADVLSGDEGKVVPVTCDVTDPQSVAAMVAAAKAHGDISVLVNNAGAGHGLSLGSTTIDGFRADLRLNLEAAYICFEAVCADLKRSNGALINIASVNGLGAFGHPAYSAAKAGLIHFTKLVAVEYGKFGIRANAVAPGTVRTQAWEDRASTNPGIFDEVKRWYPLERIARPDDVAAAVAFLAGPQAAAISGVCLPVDCGLSAGQTELARSFTQSDDY